MKFWVSCPSFSIKRYTFFVSQLPLTANFDLLTAHEKAKKAYIIWPLVKMGHNMVLDNAKKMSLKIRHIMKPFWCVILYLLKTPIRVSGHFLNSGSMWSNFVYFIPT